MVNVIWTRRFNHIIAKRGKFVWLFQVEETAREFAIYCVSINFDVNFEEVKDCKNLSFFLTSVRGFGFNKQV